MYGIFQGLHFFLLQNQNYSPGQWYKTDNPMDAVTVLIALGAILLVVVLYHVFRSIMGSSSSPGRSSASSAPRKFNAFSFYRIASTYGLDRDQSKLLESIFRNEQVADPERVMSNSTALDRHFKKAYRSITRNSANDEDTQQRLVKLFSLRNVIEAAPSGDENPANHIADNTPAVLVIDSESYPVRVLSSQGQTITTEIPRNALGTPAHLAKGMQVTLSFFTKSSKGFSVEGQITGSQRTENGPGLVITHSGRTKPLVKRKYRRKQTTIRCEFFHVRVDDSGSGRNKAPKLVVDNKRYMGTVMDISIGGCSIKTANPIQVGSRLKIGIDYDSNSIISVLGQVLRINRSGPTGATIIHIKFLRVPRRAFNSISATVFGYDED